MKNILSLLALVLITATTLAQDHPQNTYFLDGDVIVATLYRENGKIAQTGFYTKHNNLTGQWVSYDTEGNKTAVAQYDNGNKVGTWYFFTDENIKEVNYLDARIATVVTWKTSDTKVVSN